MVWGIERIADGEVPACAGQQQDDAGAGHEDGQISFHHCLHFPALMMRGANAFCLFIRISGNALNLSLLFVIMRIRSEERDCDRSVGSNRLQRLCLYGDALERGICAR